MENITVENCNLICDELSYNADPLKPVRVDQSMAWKVIHALCVQLGMSFDPEKTNLQMVVTFITENCKK